MAQLVKCLTLDFGSGYDLMVCAFEPGVRIPCWDSLSLSPSLSASPPLTHTLSLSLSLKIKAYLVVQCLLLVMKPAPVHASEDGEEDMKEALFNWF